jgi:hypothetical protein
VASALLQARGRQPALQHLQPILFHLLDQVDVVQDQHFMLQKEVIDRMVADRPRPPTAACR